MKCLYALGCKDPSVRCINCEYYGMGTPTVERKQSSFDNQVGGGHYKDMPIQPVQFIHANKLPFIEGCVVKYICRHGRKNGKQDLLKIIEFCNQLIELDYQND